MNNRFLSKIWVLIVLIIAVGGGIFVWQYSQKPGGTELEVTEGVVQEKDKMSEETSQKETGFKYPNDQTGDQDLRLRFLEPEEMPSVSPPAGYIGYPYEVTGARGVQVPKGAVLKLSYTGEDIQSLGVANLVIFHYYADVASWKPLPSTIDQQTLTVSASITESGLYTISAVIPPDSESPSISWSSPAAAGANLSGLTDLWVDVSDNVGVARVDFGLGDEILLGEADPNWNHRKLTADFRRYTSGQYTLLAIAWDRAGNHTIAEIPVTVTSDAQAPEITITQPSSGSTVSGEIVISGSATDDEAVAYFKIKLDGVPIASDEVVGTKWSILFPTDAFSNGTHTLQAVAYDNWGNKGMVSVVLIFANK